LTPLISKTWSAYRAAFRADAHQLLAWGYQDAKPGIQLVSEETAITGLLVQAIEARLDDPMTPERFERYEAVDEYQLPGEDLIGKHRKRADIRIKSNVLRPRPRYIFEAKRLKKTSHGIERYLGEHGMRRFLDDTSYSQYPDEIAMVGYIQNETPAWWLKELSDALSEDSADPYSVATPLSSPSENMPFENCRVSTHTKHDGNTAEITHILLDCSESLPAAT
jgi:hypothetical protein